jgi:hypothetical protein
MLEKFGGEEWVPTVFDALMFPRGTRIWYCYWAYLNNPGVVLADPKIDHGQWWMRIKFDHLKQSRWVPVTSPLGCHIGLRPFDGNVRDTLYRMDVDWQMKDREYIDKLRRLGIVVSLDQENEVAAGMLE